MLDRLLMVYGFVHCSGDACGIVGSDLCLYLCQSLIFFEPLSVRGEALMYERRR